MTETDLGEEITGKDAEEGKGEEKGKGRDMLWAETPKTKKNSLHVPVSLAYFFRILSKTKSH